MDKIQAKIIDIHLDETTDRFIVRLDVDGRAYHKIFDQNVTKEDLRTWKREIVDYVKDLKLKELELKELI